MMRIFLFFLLGMGLSVRGATIVSYVDDDGVTVLTNLDERHSTGRFDSRFESSGNLLPLIDRVASRHGVDSDLVRAIIKVESNYDPLAVSPKNCKGLMQLHPETARRFGVVDIFDPAQNIEGGVRYLSYLMSTFGEALDNVLAAYNAGENAVLRYKGVPPYPETVGYVSKVKAIFGARPADNSRSSREILRYELPSGQVLITNDHAQLSDLESSAE